MPVVLLEAAVTVRIVRVAAPLVVVWAIEPETMVKAARASSILNSMVNKLEGLANVGF